MSDDPGIERARLAEAELSLATARVEGLEQLIARAEDVGRDAVARLASLLRELGVDVGDAPPSRLSELVAKLEESLVPARNQMGVLVQEMTRLAEEREALGHEREQLVERVRDLERDLASRRGAPATGRAASARLRVLTVIHDFLPRHRGGAEIYAWRVAKALIARHDVRMFFTEAHPETPSYRAREGAWDGIPFTEISHQHVASSFEASWRDRRIESLFRDVLRSFEPDVVHVHHLAHLSLGLVRVAKDAGIPVVFTLHDFGLMCIRGGRMVRPDFERCERPVPDRCADCVNGQRLRDGAGGTLLALLPESLRPVLGMLIPQGDPGPAPIRDRVRAVEERLAAARDALARADLVMSPSHWLRKTFIDSGMIDPSRIVVSDLGQDPRPFQAAKRRPSSSFRVGFLGAIVAEKGVHVLVDALNQLADLTDLEASVHGLTDVDPAYVRALTTTCRNPRVSFPGPFDPADAAGILAGFDVLVVPSLWWENSPLTIQEAFLAGVPVIVSGIGGMAEKVVDGENGLHFPPGDAAALAERIRRLHGDRGLLARLAAGRPIVKSIAEDAAEIEARYLALARPQSGG